MRLETTNLDPAGRNLHSVLSGALSKMARQLNLYSEGSIAAIHNAATSAPTTGTYAQGDFIRNSAPAELGSAGSKYLVFGWTCIASGTPGTWREFRFLTGG